MTTILQLSTRAFFVFMFFAFVFLVAVAGVAFAQDAAAPAAAPDVDFIDLIFSTTGAAIGGLFALIWAALKPPPWLQAIADALTTKEALNWEGLVDSALDRAEAYARTQFDAAKDRPGYVNAMVMFLHGYNKEIVRWADKDGNGVIDLIQSRLPAGAGPAKPPVTNVQPLVSPPVSAHTPRRKTERVQ